MSSTEADLQSLHMSQASSVHQSVPGRKIQSTACESMKALVALQGIIVYRICAALPKLASSGDDYIEL